MALFEATREALALRKMLAPGKQDPVAGSKPTVFEVLLPQGEEYDPESVYDDITRYDCAANAKWVYGSQLIIHLIADGRRDMQSVLAGWLG